MRTAGSAGTMPASLPKAEAASRRTSADGEQVSATSSSNTCGLTLFPNSVALAASFLSFIMSTCHCCIALETYYNCLSVAWNCECC